MIAPATHRGVCNRCRRDYALNADGVVRGHHRVVLNEKEPCPGSYHKPRRNTVAKIKVARPVRRREHLVAV